MGYSTLRGSHDMPLADRVRLEFGAASVRRLEATGDAANGRAHALVHTGARVVWVVALVEGGMCKLMDKDSGPYVVAPSREFYDEALRLCGEPKHMAPAFRERMAAQIGEDELRGVAEGAATWEATDERAKILNALRVWINQRPGLDPRDYDLAGYRSDSRRIAQQKADALELLRMVERRDSLDLETLRGAFRAFSGRLTWDGSKLDYCTGQYWPTEYRAAACAVLRSALWDYWRADIETLPEDPKMTVRDRLLRNARLALSPGVYRRWFREA